MLLMREKVIYSLIPVQSLELAPPIYQEALGHQRKYIT